MGYYYLSPQVLWGLKDMPTTSPEYCHPVHESFPFLPHAQHLPNLANGQMSPGELLVVQIPQLPHSEGLMFRARLVLRCRSGKSVSLTKATHARQTVVHSDSQNLSPECYNHLPTGLPASGLLSNRLLGCPGFQFPHT